MAIVSPRGNATSIAITVISKVPVSKGKMPKCLLANRGVHSVSVMKSQTDTSLKNEKDCDNKTQIIPIVVRRVIAAQANKNPSINFSFFNAVYYSNNELSKSWKDYLAVSNDFKKLSKMPCCALYSSGRKGM
jgi:hypothetical protein